MDYSAWISRKTWHWVEYQQEIVITYPDGKTVAIDIQMVPSSKLSQAESRKPLKRAMIR